LAFRVAWSSIKKIAKQDSNGKWVRKTIIKDKSKKPVKATLTREMLEESIKDSENEMIDEAFAIQKLEQSDKKRSLLDKLLNINKKVK